MANMSYCKFSNTLEYLRDCADAINDELSEDEKRARDLLVEVCREIAGTAE